MTYNEYKERRKEDTNFGVIRIRYDRIAFENIINKVKQSLFYTIDEKNILYKMLEQMKREDWLLYMAEIYQENQFSFQISDFDKHKRYLVAEVYNELIAQLLANYKDYEEIDYSDIKEWFDGLSINIELLNVIDQKFSKMGVTVKY